MSQPAENYLSLLALSGVDRLHLLDPKGDIDNVLEPTTKSQQILPQLDALAFCVSSGGQSDAYAVSYQFPVGSNSPFTLFITGNVDPIPPMTKDHILDVCTHLRVISQLKFQRVASDERMNQAIDDLRQCVFKFSHAVINQDVQGFMGDIDMDSDQSHWKSCTHRISKFLEDPEHVEIRPKWDEVISCMDTLRIAGLSNLEQAPQKYKSMWVAAHRVTDILRSFPTLDSIIRNKCMTYKLHHFIHQAVTYAKHVNVLVTAATSRPLGVLLTHRPLRIIYIPPKPTTIHLNISAVQREYPSMFHPRESWKTPFLPSHILETLETEYTNIPHCQTTLAFYMLQNDISPASIHCETYKYYVGSSEPTCLACRFVFYALAMPEVPYRPREFYTSQETYQLYPKYVLPPSWTEVLEQTAQKDFQRCAVLLLVKEYRKHCTVEDDAHDRATGEYAAKSLDRIFKAREKAII